MSARAMAAGGDRPVDKTPLPEIRCWSLRLNADMGEILTLAHLRATGWSSNKITRAVRDHQLFRLAPGLYVMAEQAPEWELRRARARAAASRRTDVLSHESAAAVHGIPYLRPDRERVHFTVDREYGGGLRGHVHVHPRPLPPEDVTLVGGVRVTTRARTAIDAAMTGDVERGVVAIDAVRLVRRWPGPEDLPPVPIADLYACLNRLGRRRGGECARRAIESSVDCSESAGESWSRIQMLTWGLPVPRLQVEHRIDGATYFVDFEWGTVVGEFDGRGKYGDEIVEQEEALDREKARQEVLEAAGFEVVRWGWRVLNTPGRIRDLLTPSLERHGQTPAS